MKRITRILILSLIALTVIAVPVLAAAYQAILTVTETGGNDYDMLPIMVTSPNKFMAENDFMDADALDTRVETLGGLEYPHMVADDRTNTVLELLTNSQQNLYFTTGNTPLTDFAIILGQGGYFTVNDDAALELDDDFSLLIEDTYLDTSVAGVIAEKPGAFSWTTDGAGNVEANIYVDGSQSQTSSNTTWTMSAGDTLRAGQKYTDSPALTVSSLKLYIDKQGSPTGTAYARMWDSAGNIIGTLGTLDVSTLVHLTPSWYTFNSTPVTNPITQTIVIGIEYTGGDVSNRIRVYSQVSDVVDGMFSRWITTSWIDSATVDLRFELIASTLVTVDTSLTSGHYDTLKLIADGTDLNLDIDGVTVDTTALGGASVPDNANDWQIGSDAVSYIGSFTIEVGGATVAEYNPTSIVLGATYDTGTVTVTNGDATVVGNATVWTSDMEGSAFVSADGNHYVVDSVTDATHLELSIVYAGGTLGAQSYNMYPCLQNETTADAYVGAITWGANPADTAAVLGSMVSTSQAFPGSVEDRDTRDILPDGGTGDWFVEPAVGAALLTNPFRPFVTILSDTTTLTERQAWVLLGLVFVIMVLIFTAKVVKGHYIITGIATGAAVLACTVFTIFPVWALVFVALAVGAGIIAERSPSF